MLHISLLLWNVICQYFVGKYSRCSVYRPPELVTQTELLSVLKLAKQKFYHKSATLWWISTQHRHRTRGLSLPSSQTLTALRHGRFHPSWFRLRSTAGDRTRKQQRSERSCNPQTHFHPCLSSFQNTLFHRRMCHVTSYSAIYHWRHRAPHTSHSHCMAPQSWHFETEISRKMTQTQLNYTAWPVHGSFLHMAPVCGKWIYIHVCLAILSLHFKATTFIQSTTIQ